MILKSKKNDLHGAITVPGSKSHTIRALILATLAEGESHIENPLEGEDCVSCAKAVEKIGACVDFTKDNEKTVWKVRGAGNNFHLPSDIIDVGNSGSVLYFLSPIVATRTGWSVFTGDKSIRTRPVKHLADLLKQAGAEVHITRPDCDAPPMIIQGPIEAKNLCTDGRLSQYISGMMMAATLLTGTTNIELTDTKETPYLKMTKYWLENMHIPVEMSSDFRHISITGPKSIESFNCTVPSDWEAVAFPLIAALISDSVVTVEQIDISETQGDDAIVDILRSVGADAELDKSSKTLTVRGGTKSRIADIEKGWINGRLAIVDSETENEMRINCSGFPDAVCALATIACFIEGKIILEDIGVCRRKETDRIEVMSKELAKLGADITAGEDFLIIRGHSPLLADGNKNPDFKLRGGTIDSFHDHRVAMSFACLGLGLPDGEEVVIKDFECHAVSFPGFVQTMNALGANFTESDT
ncbi:MAG: 3-phosphoshikimate 1-carboxyvinyltransferase [Spirochaetales bacterium]